MDTKDEIRKLISAGMFRGAANLIVSGSTSRFETLRDSVAAALETARDVGTESAQVATTGPAPLEPTPPLDGPAHLEIAEAELSYMSDAEPAAWHAIWSILSWAKLVEARHQQETAAQEASLKTLFPRSAAIDLLKEQAAATSGPTAAEMIAELRRRYPLSADLKPHTPDGPSTSKPDPVEAALRQQAAHDIEVMAHVRNLGISDEAAIRAMAEGGVVGGSGIQDVAATVIDRVDRQNTEVEARKAAVYAAAPHHDKVYLHALNPERYPDPVQRSGSDAWINLYEAWLDPAYGVVRLEMDAEGLWLWVGGEVCWQSTGERMKGLTDIDEDDAKASFEAEAKRRGGSDQERVEKAEALLEIGDAWTKKAEEAAMAEAAAEIYGMTDAQLAASRGTDALKWARAFVVRNLNKPLDVGWVLGWFAAAIEAGREAGQQQANPVTASFLPDGYAKRCEPPPGTSDQTFHRLILEDANADRLLVARWDDNGYWLGPGSVVARERPMSPEEMHWLRWRWHSEIKHPKDEAGPLDAGEGLARRMAVIAAATGVECPQRGDRVQLSVWFDADALQPVMEHVLSEIAAGRGQLGDR